MSWSSPLTATTGTLTSAQWNASVRDNLNETAPAKASTPGSIFVGTGVNSIAERLILDSAVQATETTTSTSYVSLTTSGPSITMTTGVKALVWINSRGSNSGTGASLASFGVSGATSTAADDQRGCVFDDTSSSNHRFGTCALLPLTPGTNTFLMQYRVASGTGTFQWRRMQVMGL